MENAINEFMYWFFMILTPIFSIIFVIVGVETCWCLAMNETPIDTLGRFLDWRRRRKTRVSRP